MTIVFTPHHRTVRMDGRTRDAALGLGIVVAALAGVAFIIFGDVTLTTVGILLVILSAVGFLVVVKDFIVRQESDVTDLPKGGNP